MIMALLTRNMRSQIIPFQEKNHRTSYKTSLLLHPVVLKLGTAAYVVQTELTLTNIQVNLLRAPKVLLHKTI